MSAGDDRTFEDDGEPKAPVVVLPGAGPTTTQGLGLAGGTVAGAPVLPQPVVPSDVGQTSPDNLADRIEQILAQDGRFRTLLPALTVSADDAGHITLSGSLPDLSLKRSLLATLHAVPGVTAVDDGTQ